MSVRPEWLFSVITGWRELDTYDRRFLHSGESQQEAAYSLYTDNLATYDRIAVFRPVSSFLPGCIAPTG